MTQDNELSIVRAGKGLMDEVRAVINSNYSLYKDIVHQKDLGEHQVNQEWACRNFAIREFYLMQRKNDAGANYVGMFSFQVLGYFAYVGYFYIKHHLLRNGLGTSMMDLVEKRALDEGVHDLRLFANPRATWALSFYLKRGFHVMESDKSRILAIDGGILAPFYEEDALLMQKDVARSP